MHYWFISDVHISRKNSQKTQQCQNFIRSIPKSDRLFILGDFFDEYLGDDSLDEIAEYKQWAEFFYEVSCQGLDITMMYGNHDFLMKDDFVKKTQVKLVTEDEYILDLAGEKVLLMHGDSLCTFDAEYLKYRFFSRKDDFTQELLSYSIHERVKALYKMTEQRGINTQSKKLDDDFFLIDSKLAVSKMQHYNCQYLIHGHIHKPSVHYHTQNNQVYKRFVLGYWDNSMCWALKMTSVNEYETLYWN